MKFKIIKNVTEDLKILNTDITIKDYEAKYDSVQIFTKAIQASAKENRIGYLSIANSEKYVIPLYTSYKENVFYTLNNESPSTDIEVEYIKASSNQYGQGICYHMPAIRYFASQSRVIVELGMNGGNSSRGLISGRPEIFITCDIKAQATSTHLKNLCNANKIDFTFFLKKSIEIEIPNSDLLFVDSNHSYGNVIKELTLHAPKINKFILFHDTDFGGVTGAINQYFDKNREWHLVYETKVDHGLSVYQKNGVSE